MAKRLRSAAKRHHGTDLAQEVYWGSGENKRPSQSEDKVDRERKTEIQRHTQRDRETGKSWEIEGTRQNNMGWLGPFKKAHVTYDSGDSGNTW